MTTPMMKKYLHRLRVVYFHSPIKAVFRALLIYIIVAIVLNMASAYVEDPTPNEFTREEDFKGNILVVAVIIFSLLTSPLFVPLKGVHQK